MTHSFPTLRTSERHLPASDTHPDSRCWHQQPTGLAQSPATIFRGTSHPRDPLRQPVLEAGIRGLLEHLSSIPPHSAVRPPQKSLRAESSSLAIRLIDNKSIHREIQLDHCIQSEVIQIGRAQV